jgi:hypothetical protein
VHESRWTATAWLLGGLAWVTNGLVGLGASDGTAGFYVSEVAWLFVHAAVLVGIVGLRRSGATGGLRWGRVALELAIVARVLFFAFEVVAIARATDEIAVFPLAVVGSGLGLLVGGIAIVRAGRWQGWTRYLPTLAGAYPFLAIVPVFAVTGSRPPDAVVAGWGLTFVAVGAALARLGPRKAPVEVTGSGGSVDLIHASDVRRP